MYSCQVCGRSYTWPGDLRRHTNIKHSGERGNSRTDDVSKYKEDQSTASKNLDCPMCKKSFIWPSDLSRHLRAKHSEQTQHNATVDTSQQKQDQQKLETDAKQESSQLENNSEEVTDHISEQKQDEHLPGTDPIEIPDVETRWMQFRHPASALVVGPSGSGKTWLLVRILTHLSKLFDVQFDDFVWHFGIKQDFHKDIKKRFPKITFIEGLPDYSAWDASKKRFCVLDDLQNQTKGNTVSDLFTKVSHHKNTTVFYILQNLFPKNKEQRDISLNAKYFLIFKNPRDMQQVGLLGSQMGKHDLMKKAYAHATSRPHGYLMIDVTQEANDLLRFRTNIFPDDDVNLVYLP